MSQSKEHPSGNDATVKTVLVVEDDTGIGSFLVQAITQETLHHAMLVTDGLQAIKAVSNIKPSLLILDYQLPHMNGIEIYDHLHATKGLEDVPAIMISARLPRKEIAKRNIVAMSKPLELDDFLQAIEKLLG
ncbi:MAG TPA: response regulator [Ktedonobacter sp.]|nr:response regulator [Ktedonobacter sp.]HAG99980.1 response regulator [Ktedonobacter sp.]HAT43947.1 response regulator [Ktedonobacter sp.]HBE25051.1 response regulator [Ktedonobacter sp.]HCF84128.1 response regulator [Ktedonobacter sp.]